MQTMSIRIDEDFFQQLKKRSEMKGIKFTRYVRDLLRLGIAVDNGLDDSQKIVESRGKGNRSLDVRVAEMVAEILINVRKAIEVNPSLDGDRRAILASAEKDARSYVSKFLLEDL